MKDGRTTKLCSGVVAGAIQVALFVFLSSLSACVHTTSDGPDDLLLDDDLTSPSRNPKPAGSFWEDLTTALDFDFVPDPAMPIDDIHLTPARLSGLPHPIRSNEPLAKLVLMRRLTEPVPYDLGVLGKVGSAKMFVTTADQIRDYDRLYWVMVKVLSEKYGCFMVTKLKDGDKTKITCRDKRQIMLWRSRGDDWIQFYSRQYDRDGFEIMVKNKKIVRISNQRII